MNSNVKTAVLWVVLICVAVLLYVVVKSGRTTADQQVTFTEFMNYVDQNRVKQIAISGTDIHGTLADQTKFRTTGPVADTSMLQMLQSKGVNVKYEKEEQNNLWLTILGQWMPVVFLFVFFVLFMRQLQGTGGKAMTFGKSKAKLLSESHNKVTFFCCVEWRRARLLPKLKALLPPLCIWRIMNIQNASSNTKGIALIRIEIQFPLLASWNSRFTPLSRSVL